MLVVVYDGSLCKKLGIYKLVEDKDITITGRFGLINFWPNLFGLVAMAAALSHGL